MAGDQNVYRVVLSGLAFEERLKCGADRSCGRLKALVSTSIWSAGTAAPWTRQKLRESARIHVGVLQPVVVRQLVRNPDEKREVFPGVASSARAAGIVRRRVARVRSTSYFTIPDSGV